MLRTIASHQIPAGWSLAQTRPDIWQGHYAKGAEYADVTYYCLGPSMLLLDIDLHCTNLPTLSGIGPHVLAVNWCSQGRCEASSPHRGSTVVDAGRVCISSNLASTFTYPTGSYRGLELIVDMSGLDGQTAATLENFGINLPALEQRLCASIFALTIEPPAVCRHALLALSELLACPSASADDLRLAVCLLLACLKQVNPASNRIASAYLQKSQRELAQQLHDAIEQAPDQPSSVQRIAAEAGISEASLRGYFARTYGTTPAAFARSLALNRAAHLLAATDRPVSDIALACGYSNPSKFSAAFRKEFDTNPVEYRRRRRLEAGGGAPNPGAASASE